MRKIIEVFVCLRKKKTQKRYQNCCAYAGCALVGYNAKSKWATVSMRRANASSKKKDASVWVARLQNSSNCGTVITASVARKRSNKRNSR